MGRAIQPDSQDTGKQMLRRTMETVGANAVPYLGPAGKAAKPLELGAKVLGSSLLGGGSAAVAKQAFPNSPTAEMVAELAGLGLGTGGIAATEKLMANKAAKAAVPTMEKLKSQASALYDDAEKNGITASQQLTQKLHGDITQIAKDEGLISPSGRMADSYPKVKDAIRMVEDYSNGTMTPTQMKAVRRSLQNAAQSADGSESRVGSIMLSEFDKFTSKLAPQFKKANQLYHAASKAKTLETLDELASRGASKFSASGLENSRRNEYRTFAKKIIRGTEKGWTPAEIDAINKVGDGTKTSNTLRNIGRMAPTGPVSFGTSVVAPYSAGALSGSPFAGAVMATGLAGTGYAGRLGANALGAKAARDADLLVRSMGIKPNGQINIDMLKRMLLGTMAAPAVNQSR